MIRRGAIFNEVAFYRWMGRRIPMPKRALIGRDLALRYPDWSEAGAVIGARIRRLRTERGMSLVDLANRLQLPNDGRLSPGHLSQLERGRTCAPLYAYVAIAEALPVKPGLLLGADDADKLVSDAELMLLRVLRRLEIPPDEVLARLAPTNGRGAGLD